MTDFSVPKRITDILSSNGYEAYLVGGCVRDFFLKRPFADADICTSATPEEVKKCFPEGKILETGIKHGTVTLLIYGETFEITTFRKEANYKDNRHPSSVKFTEELSEDLSRRDFTMNAIAMKNGEITDPFNGIQDIENKTIKAVGDPDERFTEDALRILRAIRFSSTLNFSIEKHTEDSIFKNKELLLNISAERISSEFNKLLTGENAEKVLLRYSSVIAVFIPEILPTIDFNQYNPFHIYDVYTHTVKAISAAVNIPEVRLALFFHDMAKPSCFTRDEDGTGHFKGHADAGEILAKKTLTRLKYDNKTIKTVCFLVKNHYMKIKSDKIFIKKYLKNCSEQNFRLFLKVIRADNLAKANFAKKNLSLIDKTKKELKDILSKNECFSLKTLAVKGSDMENIGITGKNIGKALDFILDKVIEEKVINKKEAILSNPLLNELTQFLS